MSLIDAVVGRDPSFRLAWSGVMDQDKRFAEDVSLWDHGADRFRRSVSIGGLIVAVLGAVVAGIGAFFAGRTGVSNLALLALGMVTAGLGR